MTFDAQGLLEFTKKTEGAPPPVFAGRGDVLDDIEDAAGLAWESKDPAPDAPPTAKGGAAKNTRIVQGAPGAGKSSILAELVRRSAKDDGAESRARVVTFESSEIVENLPQVLRTVAAAASLKRSRWREILGNVVVGLNAGLPSVSFDIGRLTDVSAPENLSDLAGRHPREEWEAPVIVAVDEAQALPGDMTAKHALFLRGIHNAVRGLPLSLVLAGLGNTRDAAHQMDLTRGTTIHEVGGLSTEESAGLMVDFCRHFGIDPSGHEERLDALASPCEGWPRHLHFAMQALAAEALRCEGNLAGVDWAGCGNEAAESRTRYYSGQQSAAMTGSASLVAGVMRSLVPDMKMGEVLEAIWRLERDSRDKGPQWSLPKDLDVHGFYAHLVHRGALQERADHTVHCPIPSFRTHLVRAGGLHMAEAIRDGE